jgi:4-hydroxybenzoate polyprenyltransferase
LFGIFGALSGPLLTTNPSPDPIQILLQVPKVFLWTWLNTLIFVLANQRLPESILEDKLNKPFRPLAAGRITPAQTRHLMLLSIPSILALTYFHLGSYEETVLLFCLNWMYNDLGGSDEDFVTRNLIIGAAYVLYGSGALRVAAAANAEGHTMNAMGYAWSGVVGAIIFTTMQVQDLKDQEGDRSRNRKTAPLILGDLFARWTVAIAIVGWSIFCPIFWRLTNVFAIIPLSLGLVVAVRVLCIRCVDADRITWKLWSYWLALIYAFPVVKTRC